MFHVLQSKLQIIKSRSELERLNRSVLTGKTIKFLQKIGLSRSLVIGDFLKSWDVEKTLDFIGYHIPMSAKILDLGAFRSELPISLAGMGFNGVHGIDLNPDVVRMPRKDVVTYSIGDFMQTPFDCASFDVVTAISVIEHGYEPTKLFAEVSRLLRSGGYFIASFDYWPEKIEVGNTRFFDMSWTIFSAREVREMVEFARDNQMYPIGSIDSIASQPAINCMGFNYTFGWIVLRRN